MKKLRQRVYGINKDADAARLGRIVKATNAFIARGQRSPITIGHSPGEDYNKTLTLDIGSDQAATNFSTDGLWVYADLDTDPLFDGVVKRHRGISCEVFSDDVICPIALLAENRPAIEVGPLRFDSDPEINNVDLSRYLLKYAHEGEHTTYTVPPENAESEESDMDVTAVKNLVSECLQGSDVLSQMKALNDTVSQLSLKVQSHDEMNEKLAYLFEEDEVEGEMADDPSTQGDNAVTDPEKSEMSETPMAEKPAAEGVEKKEMALPSGTNTFVPGTETAPKKKNYEELELERETYRLTAENQEAIAKGYGEQLAAEAEAKNVLAAENANLVKKYQMLERKNDLILLSGKYQFDPEKEMVLVANMTDEQFAAHKEITVKKYAMPPVGRAPIAVGNLPKPAGNEPEVIPQAKVAEVAKYAMKRHSDGAPGYTGGANDWELARKELAGK